MEGGRGTPFWVEWREKSLQAHAIWEETQRCEGESQAMQKHGKAIQTEGMNLASPRKSDKIGQLVSLHSIVWSPCRSQIKGRSLPGPLRLGWVSWEHYWCCWEHWGFSFTGFSALWQNAYFCNILVSDCCPLQHTRRYRPCLPIHPGVFNAYTRVCDLVDAPQTPSVPSLRPLT